jgi:predicted unusual protein kinase regulating ubiquinone biosynthesis (AarF/ABC1/UbiB family)
MGSSNDQSDSFPSTKMERGKIFAKTGLKVGANYARYLRDRVTGRGGDRETQKRDLNTKNAEDLFKEFTKLRGTALKLAQGLSMDSSMLPEEFAEVMAEAQYRVPPMNRALVRKRVRDALGSVPERLFESFTPDAVAAASIGQVHRATLEDGRDVAVKVQYPNVRDTIDSDLSMARTLIRRMIKSPHLDDYFEEIRARLMEETDYLNEAENIAFFADQYDYENVVTPRPVADRTAETVLTMTFVEGDHLTEFLDTDPSQARRNHFGQLLWDVIHEQVASNHRTIHADAHPGNFLFRDDGRLGIIDFGCVKTFPQAFRDNMLLLYRARMDEDADAIEPLLHRLDILRDEMSPTTQDLLRDFFDRFGSLIVRPYRQPSFDFGDPAFHEELNACFRDASEFRETTGSPHFIFLNKVLVGLFSLMLKLKPTIDTTHSRDLLHQAIDRIERTTEPAA